LPRYNASALQAIWVDLHERRATCIPVCLGHPVARLSDEETTKVGFDFRSTTESKWLKPSADLVLRLSRLASFFAFFPITLLAAHQRGEAMAHLARQHAAEPPAGSKYPGPAAKAPQAPRRGNPA
jgi:hypothetical protein